MSNQAITWALETKTNGPMTKVLLIALANYADHDNTTFVGIERLARETDMSPSSVKRHMNTLVETGLVQRTHRPDKVDGGRQSNMYTLIGPEVRGQADPRGNGSETGGYEVKSGGGKGSPVVPEPSLILSEPFSLADSSADDAFDLFWRTYPKKRGAPAKHLVKAKWAKQVKRYSAATIQAGIEQQIKEWAAERPPKPTQFMPMITKWLNAEAWDTLDEVDGGPQLPVRDTYAFTEGIVREPTW